MKNDQYKAQIAAKFLARSQDVAFLTDYVTPNGVFVRTDSPPPVMELLRIEFTLPPDWGTVVLHGVATRMVLPRTKHSAPGVEIALFAKGGEQGRRWDEFLTFLQERYPESISRPVVLARDTTDQVRRAHPRLVPHLPVEVGAPQGSFSVGDVSDGGMFIKTSQAFVVGSDLRVTLTHPRTLEVVPFDCVVRRRAFGGNAGIGVEFRSMNEVQRGLLRELVGAAPGAAEAVEATCHEVLAPAVPQIMNTLPGPGSRGAAFVLPPEDTWAPFNQD